ncbi:5-formyltetrahydrofolate cyclo-ligase [Nocardioides humi]|uniref:5-formyltetrahydrofolate cyclo-ligase n=1 Tax=Nocardioides humi TaxID=449461 RepID=UPI0024832CD7|nr:5-formyltetrahydrofolate cyclo-ligase [Nocardioides humi]
MLEPLGEPLGVDAVATADVVLVPGLAVSTGGLRLGRGGGSYDRALARVPVGTFTCVLLYDDEVLPEVPAEPHDRPVTAAATPSGVVRVRPG